MPLMTGCLRTHPSPASRQVCSTSASRWRACSGYCCRPAPGLRSHHRRLRTQGLDCSSVHRSGRQPQTGDRRPQADPPGCCHRSGTDAEAATGRDRRRRQGGPHPCVGVTHRPRRHPLQPPQSHRGSTAHRCLAAPCQPPARRSRSPAADGPARGAALVEAGLHRSLASHARSLELGGTDETAPSLAEWFITWIEELNQQLGIAAQRRLPALRCLDCRTRPIAKP